MQLTAIPLVGRVFSSGAEDRVLDSLLLLGPGLIAVTILGGRNPVTVGLASAYVLTFVGYVAFLGRGTDADGL
jgi:hypothetical protein